jgi:hypothetical protein
MHNDAAQNDSAANINTNTASLWIIIDIEYMPGTLHLIWEILYFLKTILLPELSLFLSIPEDMVEYCLMKS